MPTGMSNQWHVEVEEAGLVMGVRYRFLTSESELSDYVLFSVSLG